MIKNIFKAIGCLSLVVTAFNPVLAQENQTPASVEKLKIQNIWMNNTTKSTAFHLWDIRWIKVTFQ